MPDLKREFTFISYAHEDLNQVRKLYDGLKERKVNAWFDKVDIGPGRWKDKIEKAISRSRYFIFCLSEASLKKTGDEKPGFVDKELHMAWKFASEQDETGFTIIPVRFEDCGRGDMRLSGWQQYDLFADWQGGLDTLAVNLGGKSLSDASAEDERTEDEKMVAGLIGKGNIFYYSDEYEKALSIYESAINIKPDDHLAWYSKGVTLYDLGRHDEAIKAYDKAIELKTDDHLAWFGKGYALSSLSRHDEAIKAYDKAIKLKPDFYQAWFNKGYALSSLSRHDEALEAVNKVIELNPSFFFAFLDNVADLEKLGRKEEARKAFDKHDELKKNLKK